MAVGDKFADAQRPKAMITVGQGEKNGLVQLENLLFTSRGSLPGLALLQWNLQSTKQGDVGLWGNWCIMLNKFIYKSRLLTLPLQIVIFEWAARLVPFYARRIVPSSPAA